MDPIHSAFFFSGRRRHTIWTGDWSSDVCSSDLTLWPVISWTTEKSPPFLDISSLKVYSVGETCLTVTRTLYLSSPRSEERRVGKECGIDRSRDYSNQMQATTVGLRVG